MAPNQYYSESQDIKDRAYALCGRRLDFKTASKFLTQHARKHGKSLSTSTGRPEAKISKKLLPEPTQACRNKKQSDQSRSRPAAARPIPSAPRSKKRGRDEVEDRKLDGKLEPHKKAKLETFEEASVRSLLYSQPSRPAKPLAQPRARQPPSGRSDARKVPPPTIISDPSSENAVGGQKVSVTGPNKRKTDDTCDSLAKKAKIDSATHSSIITPTSAPAGAAPNSPESTIIDNNTPAKVSLKRKAEDDIWVAVKKSKVGQPLESTNYNGSSTDTEESMARRARKQDGGGRSGNSLPHGTGKIGREITTEPAAKSDIVNIAQLNDTQVSRDEAGAADMTAGEVKEAEARALSHSLAEEVNPDIGRRPARMANAISDGDLMCFANSVIQAIDVIPELRDRLIAKGSTNNGPAFPAFPTRTGSVKTDREAERLWLEEIDQILREQDRTFGQCLGQTLRHMHAAAQKGNKVCVRGLMKMFSRRHPDYDGVSSQQEAFDFLDKVFQLLEEEDAAKVAASKQASYVVKDLFGGQKYTQLDCACGDKRDAAHDSAYSLQLNMDSKCRTTTVPSCLNRAFASVEVEDFPCESCKKKQTISKKDCIKTWGNYLILHLNRAETPDPKGRAKFIKTKIEIPTELSLDDVMLDGQSPVIKPEEGKMTPPATVHYEPIAFIERRGDEYASLFNHPFVAYNADSCAQAAMWVITGLVEK
ncbi:MAG: hypothetical protein Q9215_004374 [Flavoplaca cf. flavocitrina]